MAVKARFASRALDSAPADDRAGLDAFVDGALDRGVGASGWAAESDVAFNREIRLDRLAGSL